MVWVAKLVPSLDLRDEIPKVLTTFATVMGSSGNGESANETAVG
ncbi:hypothetical protein RISK_005520 [Rhodopirellula islandica]|uniref:Uncharacterized protein n=1 Tax=Rhodopirellula islandica TaxID=595434 RepID=A0A0J1EAD1_RHOIS|nr:hypothetical protein RISK_005520 [Rhodopirellula islandica]